MGTNRISCNRNNIGQWEKFEVQIVEKSAALKLLRHGNVVAFKGGKGRKYCADEGNNVKCNRNRIGQSEKFKAQDAGGGNIALRGGKNNKLCADETNQIKCNRNNIGQWEKFKVQNVKKSAALKLLRHGNVVAFKGGKGRKYCADEGNNVKCNRNKIGQWEKMKIVNAGGGKVAIRGGKGNKLCADEYSRSVCNRNRIGQSEKFKAQDAGGGNIALRGGELNKLCADETNRIKC